MNNHGQHAATSPYERPDARRANQPEQAGAEFPHNPLLAVANPLLNMISRIRHLSGNVDSVQLRLQLIDTIRRFEIHGQRTQIPRNMLIAARYCLCTVLDETASLTAWGHHSVWSRSGLLVTFHNETEGGEKFFQILARISRSPHEYLHLLELMNYCLLLGFEGRYRIMDNGLSQLETLKQRLLQLIRSVRGAHAAPLSPQAADHAVPPRRWRPMLPLWMFGLALALVACLYFTVLDWQLGTVRRPLVEAIQAIRLPGLDLGPTLAGHTLRELLQPDIAAGNLDVRESGPQSTVVIHSDTLFGSGSADLHPAFHALMQRVAGALNLVPGNVVVRGFTDSDRITNGRYASNAALSMARAEAVKTLLQETLERKDRVSAAGLGATEPIAPNNTAADKALNRRVEITLLPYSRSYAPARDMPWNPK